jgi:hypothetical protein
MTPRLRIPRPFAGALMGMLAASCTNSAGCDCPPERVEAVLYGRVTDAAGHPVADATVRAENGLAGCQHLIGELGWDATDADGRYRAQISHVGGPVECLRVFALPPAGSALRGSDTVPFQVRFAHPIAVDSARVDLVLRTP